MGRKKVRLLCKWKIQEIKSKRKINIESLHKNLALLRITFYSISCFPMPFFLLYICCIFSASSGVLDEDLSMQEQILTCL